MRYVSYVGRPRRRFFSSFLFIFYVYFILYVVCYYSFIFYCLHMICVMHRTSADHGGALEANKLIHIINN